jgi:hypothetical protein
VAKRFLGIICCFWYHSIRRVFAVILVVNSRCVSNFWCSGYGGSMKKEWRDVDASISPNQMVKYGGGEASCGFWKIILAPLDPSSRRGHFDTSFKIRQHILWQWQSKEVMCAPNAEWRCPGLQQVFFPTIHIGMVDVIWGLCR